MKAYQTPSNMPLCVHVFMLPHSAPLPLSRVQKHTRVHTHGTHLTLFLTLYHSKIRKIMQKCIDTCTRDVTLTKVTRHLSNSRLRSAPCIVTVEAAYWSSQAEILRRRFHNSIWHKPTTKRINNITGVFFSFFSGQKGWPSVTFFEDHSKTGTEKSFIIC